ncbi:HNH endonuclease signature motif containing protein, partial [Gordonia cholesterolivorans]
RDRKRLRGFTILPQDLRLMSKVRGYLTPALRAEMEAALPSWAAPGMNNPDDPDSPSGTVESADPAALAAAVERDTRTPGQRTHDGLQALLRASRTGAGGGRRSGDLVITITDHELAERAGIALTATGTRLPVAELIEVAATATPHLAVFSAHTGQALYLGRGRRLASRAQRLMLFARDRGCTAPGCDAPFTRTQAHHFPDWADGGPTDIDHLGAACGRHNRSVGPRPGQWQTMILIDGPHAG